MEGMKEEKNLMERKKGRKGDRLKGSREKFDEGKKSREKIIE